MADEVSTSSSSDDDDDDDDDDSVASDGGAASRQEEADERGVKYRPRRGARRIGGELAAKDANGKKTSHFYNAVLNGKFDRGSSSRGDGVRDAFSIMDKDAMNANARGAGFLVNLYQFAGVECAVLKLFPQEAEGLMIAKWAASATDSNVVCDQPAHHGLGQRRGQGRRRLLSLERGGRGLEGGAARQVRAPERV
mmetsp:Transcript_32330/g.113772  ORF Transcript_32330/g.113772 Transcript_32330/m.113772 type:complete len:195 (+) Transcript_32330:368-952(+)